MQTATIAGTVFALACCAPALARAEDHQTLENVAPGQEGMNPDLVLARLIENPTSGITRVPVANSASFGIPPNDGVAYALVAAPIIPALFRSHWSIITRTTIPFLVTVPVGST